jgi:penicillin amidase
MRRRLTTAIRFAAIILCCATTAAFVVAAEPTRDEILAKSKAALAQVDGELALPGLQQPVEVLRDKWGVPHIYAKSVHDLFYAQGVTAAQDRLFQIDLWRRTATGELAEVLGEEAVPRDRMARLVRYRGDWDAEWAGYGPGAKDIATAFTAGINAYIESLGEDAARLPIEFQIAGYKPGKWKPEDVVGRMAGIAMVRNFTNELARAELIGTVGFDKAQRLMPLDPPTKYSWPVGLGAAGLTRDVLALQKASAEKIRFTPPKAVKAPAAASGGGDGPSGDGFDEGSNNWVVAGAHTDSGKPILANDPHRTLGLPALRYLVHLNAPGWNVIGGGEPALPGVAIGHNDKIAWGLTIVGTDQADVYVEETHPDDPLKYRLGDEWLAVRVEKETIRVLGRSEPIEVELLYTRHGPVIHEDRKQNKAYALRWTGSEPGTAGYLGSLALNRAGNWDEFRKGVAMWRVPSENLIYADVEGNIGWIAAAQTPRRARGLGVLPLPGFDPGNDWLGFLPTELLPTEYNPPRGFIGTANANILPPGYNRNIAFEWAPPFRQDRVRGVLTSQLAGKKKHTVEDSIRLQQDNVSLAAQAVVRLAAHLPADDSELAPYVALMRKWNGDLAVDSQAGALYAIWMQVLQQEFFATQVPKPQVDILRTSTLTILRALASPTADWFAGEPKAERDALLKRTFAAAVTTAKKRFGDDTAKWSWGKLHTAKFTHPMSSLGPKYAAALDLGPVARPGDSTTANATSHDPQFAQTAGASYRHIFDLADWDRGLATSTPGQSGQPGSPHYGDLLPLWAEGKYFPLKFSRAAVDEVTEHRLMLKPAPAGKP